MFNSKAVVLLLIFTLITGATAQQPDQLTQDSARLAGSILVGGRAMHYTETLTDQIGARLTGSANYQRAAEWAFNEFRALGLKNVRYETFTFPHGWERGPAHGRIIAPVDRRLIVETLGWSPATPPGGVKAEIAVVNSLAPEKLKAEGERYKGRIALIARDAINAEGENGFVRLRASYALLKESGAQVIIIGGVTINNTPRTSAAVGGGEIAPLPIAHVGPEDEKLMRRLSDKGPVTVEVKFENRVSGPIQINNVIAELPGREQPNEWLLVGAHLDSWDFGTGAMDNATGVAMVMDAARAIVALGRAPRRSLRFALWGGEEQGLIGSKAYVDAHAAELDNCIAVLNTDNGAGHPRGWKVQGRKDVRDGMKSISNTLLSGLQGSELSQTLSFDTDHGYFMLAGVPALDLLVDLSVYNEIHHKPGDTLDKVDRHSLSSGAAIVAVTAYALAEQPERLAPRINNSAVIEILKQAGQYESLKALGTVQ